MNASPILWRELQVETRNDWNHHLRVVSVLFASLALWGLLRETVPDFTSMGRNMFLSIHRTMFSGIWILVPVLTADCLSREKREGTLGLLFLTGLGSPAIVLGKVTAHFLRALTLWLATIPILILPVLTGGIGVMDFASTLTLQGSAMLLSLAAGLTASSIAMRPVVSLVLAEAFSWLFKHLFLLGQVKLGHWIASLPRSASMPVTIPGFTVQPDPTLAEVHVQILGSGARLLPSGEIALIAAIGLLALAGFAAAFMIGTAAVRRHWGDRPPSERVLRWRRYWLGNRFWTGRFARFRAQALDKNPMRWLESHSGSRRAVVLGWCLLIFTVDAWLAGLDASWLYFDSLQMWMAILLTLNMCADACALLRYEKENGALELLLITPLPINQFIIRRLLAFWRRFAWPVGAFVAIARIMVWRGFVPNPGFDSSVFLLLNFLIVPIIGAWLSLRLQSFTSAFLLLVCITGGIGGWLPESVFRVCSGGVPVFEPWFLEATSEAPAIPGAVVWSLRAIQLACAAFAFVALRRSLAMRTFLTWKSADRVNGEPFLRARRSLTPSRQRIA